MSKDHNQYPLKEAIDKFLKVYRLDKKYGQVEVAKAWEKAMGSYIQSKTRGLYLNGTVLYIKIESSVIGQEIMNEKSKVIANLNQVIGRNLIEDILFSD
ncbi:MAG: DUF721 domain-containing protein [Flavobacteriales bacterium]